MASGAGGGGGYRNGNHKAPNLRTSSSFKSKLPPSTSNVRRSSSASNLGAADAGMSLLLRHFGSTVDCFINVVEIECWIDY